MKKRIGSLLLILALCFTLLPTAAFAEGTSVDNWDAQQTQVGIRVRPMLRNTIFQRLNSWLAWHSWSMTKLHLYYLEEKRFT